MGTVVVVRHGETDWNRERRSQGWAPTPLNDRGREQVRTLATYLADTYDLDRVLTSDLRRARQTAAILGDADTVPADATPDTAWRERNKGVLQGITPELRDDVPDDRVTGGEDDPLARRPENGESHRDLQERVTDRWTALTATERDRDRTTALTTHGGVVCAILARVRDDPLAAVREAADVPNAALWEIAIDADGARLVDHTVPWRS
ncbi:histidine phosphatase family protein [Halobacteriales archaeon SW_7_68_16]|nr:MAG: histidine phosphatase family protein [Halobacteriales archaeon SW_7_68_16]